MMKQTDIFNDESLQNDIQDLVAIEQAMIRKTYPLPNLDKELEKIVGKENSDAEEPVKHQYPMMRMLMSAFRGDFFSGESGGTVGDAALGRDGS